MRTEPSAAGDGPGDRAPSRAPGRSFEPRHLESPSTGPALVDVADLTVTLATRRGPVTAVNGVTFTLRTGETLGVVGESGSGKSMLIRSILSLVPPNATIGGEITLGARGEDGSPTASSRLRLGRDIGTVFQNPLTSLNPVRTIGAQLRDPLRHHLGLRRKSADLRAIELLEMVRIPDPAKRLRQYPYELSGGMRQRVAIATALACGPRLLIADEPTTALDVTVQAQILELIESLQRESGMAMILVSHDLSIIRDRVQKTLIMYAGKVVESGETAVTFDHPHHPYTAALIAAMPRLDAPAGTPLRPIAGGPPDLVDLRPGCAFAPRCEYARLLCSRTTPVVTHLGASREVRCHFPLEASLGDLGTSARPFVGGASATAAS